MSEEAQSATQAAVDEPPFIARFIKSALIVALVGLAPAIAIGMVAGPTAAGAFPFGLMGGMFASTGDSRTYAMKLLPLLVVGSILTAASGGTWWWVLVIALVGAIIGWGTRLNRALAFCEVAIVVTTADPIHDPKQLGLYAIFVTLGYLFGVLIGRISGAPEFNDKQPLAHVDPVRAAILGFLALGASAAIALLLQLRPEDAWVKPFWLPMTFLILLEFVLTHDGGWRMVIFRVLGTFLGIAVILPLVLKLPGPFLVVAFVALLAAGLAMSDDLYWLSAACITTSVVIFSSSGENPLAVGEQRFGAAWIALVLLGAVTLAFGWVRNGSRPEAKA